MLKSLIVVALFLVLGDALAQVVQSCLCTQGCTIVSDPYPPSPNQPTSCTVYKDNGATFIANGLVVQSFTIPANNSAVCVPASQIYDAGVNGSVACAVVIPPQPLGNVTLQATATNATGETALSVPFTFRIVQGLPALAPVPTGLRVY